MFYALCQLHCADAQDDEVLAPVNVDALSEEELRRELRKVRQPSLFCSPSQCVASIGPDGQQHTFRPCEQVLHNIANCLLLEEALAM